MNRYPDCDEAVNYVTLHINDDYMVQFPILTDETIELYVISALHIYFKNSNATPRNDTVPINHLKYITNL